MNNGNEYLIIGAVVCSEYSNIWHLHLIIGNAQKFTLCDRNGSLSLVSIKPLTTTTMTNFLSKQSD